MKLVIVTTAELENVLANVEIVNGMGAFANVVQFTDARAKKTNNPFGQIMKLSNVSVLLNTQYEKNVVNQLAREGKEATDYKKGANTMPLEKGDKNGFFGYFNGKAVIEYRPNDNVKPRTKYVANGKVVDKDKVTPFLPSTNKAQNQGTEREIFWRKLYVSNIRRITINGTHYKVVNK